jgi:hypothetical protein
MLKGDNARGNALCNQAIALKIPPLQKYTLLQRPASLCRPKRCGMGGRRHGEEENQAELPSPRASTAGS